MVNLPNLGVTRPLFKFVTQNPSESAFVLEGIRHYMKEYRSAQKALPGDTKSHAHSFHLAMDEVTALPKAGASCKRGCVYCCYLEVEISSDEADLLLAVSRDRSIPIDWKAVDEQALAENFSDIPYKGRRCVFLTERGDCSVYEHRPAACRKYLVISDPEFCNSEKYPGGQVSVVFNKLVEIISSVVYSVTAPGRMAGRLLEARARSGE